MLKVLILLASPAQPQGNSPHLCRHVNIQFPLLLSSHQDTKIASLQRKEIIVIVGLWTLTAPDDDIAKQMFSLR